MILYHATTPKKAKEQIIILEILRTLDYMKDAFENINLVCEDLIDDKKDARLVESRRLIDVVDKNLDSLINSMKLTN